MKKEIVKRLNKNCACCGKNIKVVLYKDKSYRSGHYFDKIPLHTEKELKKALKAGTRKVKIVNHIINDLKKDAKPYGYKEYWECPKCYWRK